MWFFKKKYKLYKKKGIQTANFGSGKRADDEGRWSRNIRDNGPTPRIIGPIQGPDRSGADMAWNESRETGRGGDMESLLRLRLPSFLARNGAAPPFCPLALGFLAVIVLWRERGQGAPSRRGHGVSVLSRLSPDGLRFMRRRRIVYWKIRQRSPRDPTAVPTWNPSSSSSLRPPILFPCTPTNGWLCFLWIPNSGLLIIHSDI
jgi:hypothetical protein